MLEKQVILSESVEEEMLGERIKGAGKKQIKGQLGKNQGRGYFTLCEATT